MMFVVYGVIIFLASGIGAFLGGGSGVIIKPLLTLLVDDTTEVINFISSVSALQVFQGKVVDTVSPVAGKVQFVAVAVKDVAVVAVAGEFQHIRCPPVAVLALLLFRYRRGLAVGADPR
jgi:uncharacterized membrane protein YfcA